MVIASLLHTREQTPHPQHVFVISYLVFSTVELASHNDLLKNSIDSFLNPSNKLYTFVQSIISCEFDLFPKWSIKLKFSKRFIIREFCDLESLSLNLLNVLNSLLNKIEKTVP